MSELIIMVLIGRFLAFPYQTCLSRKREQKTVLMAKERFILQILIIVCLLRLQSLLGYIRSLNVSKRRRNMLRREWEALLWGLFCEMTIDTQLSMAQSFRSNRSSFSSLIGNEGSPLHNSAFSNGDGYDSDGSNFAPPWVTCNYVNISLTEHVCFLILQFENHLWTSWQLTISFPFFIFSFFLYSQKDWYIVFNWDDCWYGKMMIVCIFFVKKSVD